MSLHAGILQGQINALDQAQKKAAQFINHMNILPGKPYSA
jgi:hypothetical protein